MNLKKLEIILLVAAVFISCVPKNDKKISSIRIAHFPNITHSQALVGRANGYFQKALGDVNIEWKVFNAGPSEIEALFAGEIDLGYIGPVPAINGYVKSKGELQIISGATSSGAILVSRKNLIINDINQLSGKRVAIPQFGNTQDFSLRNLLIQHGLKDKVKGGTVEIRQADNPDIKILLDRGEIDAALVPEPWGSRLVKEVNARIVLDEKKIWRNGRYSTAVIIARTDFLEKHPEIVKQFLKAHVELTDYINSESITSKQIVNKVIGELTRKPLPEDVLNESFKRLIITTDPEKQSIEEFANLSVKTGMLKEQPNISNLFNLNFLDEIKQELKRKKAKP